jgi:uncharacterized membrane protein YidH (DUF202 family)
MKTTTIVGIVLILLGALALVYPKITYTDREKVIDLGPIQATAETKKTIPISPLVGGVAVISGLVLIVAGGRRTT